MVDDLERQRRFWGDLLGVDEHHSGPDFVHFNMRTGEDFEVIERSAEPQYDRRRFQVGFEVDDIASAREELIQRGVEPVTDVIGGDSSSPWAYFRDPEGNVFEIRQRADLDSDSS
ncbi:MAG TPA: VOC family protein [Nocardioidaceae bacterium]|nr:VOC family protein [Nocardioidaceae bacterium]